MNIMFYIVILLFQPLISMAYMYYTIWTIRSRSWGGARVETQINDYTENQQYIQNLEPRSSFQSITRSNPDEIRIIIH